MKVKKLLSMLLALILVVGSMNTMSVSAATHDSVQNTEYETTGILDAQLENESDSCEVECQIGSTFIVTIPKKITLSGADKLGAYLVRVSGDVAGNQTVKVVPDETFTLREAGHKADVTATVEQNKTEWIFSDLTANNGDGTTANGLVSAAITAGKWSGYFLFNIALITGETVAEQSERIATENYNNATRSIEALAAQLVTVNGNDEAFDTENEVHDYLEVQYNEAVAPYGYTATVNCVYVAPVHGTRENPTGVDGSYTYSVSITNGSKTFETEEMTLILSAVSHNYVVTDHKDATCTEAGYDVYTCEDCGDSYTVEITVRGHNFVNEICTRCGADEYTAFTLAWDNYQMTGITCEGDVVIPSEFEYEGAKYRVTSIDKYAFERCFSLTSINIPDSVTSIGEGAFYYCEGLTSITIPDSVTSIGKRAFYYCTNLTTIYYDGTATGDPWGAPSATVKRTVAGAYGANSLLFEVTKETVETDYESYQDSPFYNQRSSLELVVIPEGTTKIGDWAFAGCYNLTSIIIPNSVTSIGNNAFARCTYLTSITIPDSVTSIGDYAFATNVCLQSINIPDSVTSIGEKAFYYCEDLTSIYYNGTATGAPWGAPKATVIRQ